MSERQLHEIYIVSKVIWYNNFFHTISQLRGINVLAKCIAQCANDKIHIKQSQNYIFNDTLQLRSRAESLSFQASELWISPV